MSIATILVIEDNDELRKLLRITLETNGYDVFCTTSGQEGLNVLRAKKVDTILLDLVLPDGDGLALIASIKQLSDAPVIVISGKGNLVDKVVGLEMGADDYLGKPFSMEELGARVKANVRRYKGAQNAGSKSSPARAKIGLGSGLVLDAEKFEVLDAAGKSCGLTTAEFQLLQALAENAGRVMSREQILDAFRADSPNINDRAIDIQIARIRKKIGDTDAAIIKTIRGIGYMLVSGRES